MKFFKEKYRQLFEEWNFLGTERFAYLEVSDNVEKPTGAEAPKEETPATPTGPQQRAEETQAAIKAHVEEADKDLESIQEDQVGETVDNIGKLADEIDNPEAKQNLEDIVTELKDPNLPKKIGLENLGEMADMVRTIYLAIKLAWKAKDLKTFQEVMEDFKAKKNPAVAMETSFTAYKNTLDKKESEGKLGVKNILGAYLKPRETAANNLFPVGTGENKNEALGRYRMEARKAIKEHLANELIMGIGEIKNGPGNQPILTTYVNDKKIEIDFYDDGGELKARIYEFKESEGTEVKSIIAQKGEVKAIKSINDLKNVITNALTSNTEEPPPPPDSDEEKGFVAKPIIINLDQKPEKKG